MTTATNLWPTLVLPPEKQVAFITGRKSFPEKIAAIDPSGQFTSSKAKVEEGRVLRSCSDAELLKPNRIVLKAIIQEVDKREHEGVKDDGYLNRMASQPLPCTQPLPCMSEGADTWKAETQTETSSFEPESLAYGPEEPDLASWSLISSFLQHVPDSPGSSEQLQQLCEILKHVSRAIATLTQHVDIMQQRMKTFVNETHLEMKAAESRDHFIQLGSMIPQMEDHITAAFRHETFLREEMSKSFFDALEMERVNRANDISKLHCSFEAAMEMERANRVNDISKLHHSFQAALSSGGSTQTPTGSEGDSGSRSPVNSDVADVATDLNDLQTLLAKEELGHMPELIGSVWKSTSEAWDIRNQLAEDALQRAWGLLNTATEAERKSPIAQSGRAQCYK